MKKYKIDLLNKKDTQNLREKAAELRKYIILMNCYAGSGHLNTFLSTKIGFFRKNYKYINKIN